MNFDDFVHLICSGSCKYQTLCPLLQKDQCYNADQAYFDLKFYEK